MSKIKINQDLCIGCGTCESICSKIFKVENGKAKVMSEDCKECNPDEAINSCPVGAISSEK